MVEKFSGIFSHLAIIDDGSWTVVRKPLQTTCACVMLTSCEEALLGEETATEKHVTPGPAAFLLS